MELVKTLISCFVSRCLHILLIFPIKGNKVVFFPSNGQYYCNLKYIQGKIIKEDMPIECVWISNSTKKNSYPRDIIKCSKFSLLALYHFFTAKIIIFNDKLPSWLFKRKEQFFINTWHGGGAYKKIDRVYKDFPKWRKIRAKKIWDSIDYVVSSCKRFTQVFHEDTSIDAEYLPIGMPRNDIFFDNLAMKSVAEKVRKSYHISQDKAIVLYAPTFRDNGMNLDLNVKELLQSLEKRFHKKFVLFVRSHPHVAKDIFTQVKQPESVVDVSAYPDMQELLAASDVLITDYSSSMWDFSFTYRPCFIYANDLAHYRKERNFHTPIEEWPFPLAENNKELQENIMSFVPPQCTKSVYSNISTIWALTKRELLPKRCVACSKISASLSKRKLGPSEIKARELQILLAFQKFCEKNDLCFYLSGGTLLGAIRHKGFIPWDDDIDVCMPRDDYEKLISLYQNRQDNYVLRSIELHNFTAPFAKLVDVNTRIDSQYTLDENNSNLWIDIFPVDGLPDSLDAVCKIYSRCNFYRRIFLLADAKLGKGKTILHKYSKYLLKPLANLYSKKRCVNNIEKIARSYSYESSNYVGAITWGLYGEGERMLKSEFEKAVEVEFEGHKFPTFSCWNSYLHGLYGNYMQLPPVEKRRTHDMTVYVVE